MPAVIILAFLDPRVHERFTGQVLDSKFIELSACQPDTGVDITRLPQCLFPVPAIGQFGPKI
jgi:hypothetical protein